MANWCSNHLTWYGTVESVKAVHELFYELEADEAFTGNGQVPDFITDHENYMHELLVHEDYICYETRWAPNLADLVKIADHFRLDFIIEYGEYNNGLYGKATYENKVLTDQRLEDHDFTRIEECEDDTYLFDGEKYNSEYEILDHLVEKKPAVIVPINSCSSGHQ